MLAGPFSVQETAILLLGDLGRNVEEDNLCDFLELLLKQFGSKSSPIRSVVYTQLVDIASHRGKQPWTLFSPYLERIGVLLAECLVPKPEVVAETMQLIGYQRQSFFSHHLVRKAVIPVLVLRRNREALDMLVGILGQRLGFILIDDAAAVLSKVFLTPHSTAAALDFLVSVLAELTRDSDLSSVLGKYIRSAIIPLIAALVIELGDEDENAREAAKQALRGVQREDPDNVSDSDDLGAYLKPHMLGALAAMTEQLITLRAHADDRRKIVRSLGELILLVGDSMASFSPQVSWDTRAVLTTLDHRLPSEHPQ